MYLLLPIINKGIYYLNESELKIVVFSTIGIFVFYSDLMNQKLDLFVLVSGRSSFWFIIFYITGAYIGKYKLRIYNKKIIYCLIYIIIFFTSGFISYYFSYYNEKLINRNIILNLKILLSYRNNSLTSITEAISLSLFLYQIHYNKFIEKVINFIGPLTFGVYLIHENKLIRKYIISNLFTNPTNHYDENSIIFIVFLKAFIIFLILYFY